MDREDSEPTQDERLGVVVTLGSRLLELLRRVENGETADLVFAEVWANADHVRADE